MADDVAPSVTPARDREAPRERYGTGTPWEPIVGYSRAVRVGCVIHVSGTTATDSNGTLVGAGDVAAQTRQILENIRRAVEAVGGQLDHIVRTRIYVTDITQWDAVGRVHGEYFAAIRPTTSMVEIRRLIDPAMLVEIEAEALVP